MSAATSVALSGLAGRLTDSQDRERYTAILLYLQALPPEDEFRHLAEILGLLTLLGQRVPDALAEAMTELRELTTTVSDYHDKVDERLANLPREITDGVDLSALSKQLGEAIRQQLATTGIDTTVANLRESAKTLAGLSGQISSTLRPVSQEYKSIASTISAEVNKLTAASVALQHQNAQLIQQQHSYAWLWQGLAALVLVLFGGVCGMFLQKIQMERALAGMQAQIERIQTPIAPPAVANLPKRSRKRSGS